VRPTPFQSACGAARLPEHTPQHCGIPWNYFQRALSLPSKTEIQFSKLTLTKHSFASPEHPYESSEEEKRRKRRKRRRKGNALLIRGEGASEREGKRARAVRGSKERRARAGFRLLNP
jgi:hypothetical protein